MRKLGLCALVALLAASGCGHGCTAVGYLQGLLITVKGLPAAAGDASVGESYSVDVVAGAAHVTIPLRLGARQEVPGLAIAFILGDIQIVSLDGAGREIGGPAEATVSIVREGNVIATETFHPTYETSEPNGEGCGTAVQAFGTLTIPR